MRAAFLISAACVLAACGGDNPSSPEILTVTVTPPNPTIAVGEAVQLTAVARDVNGVTVPGAKITYSSSAATIAGVSSSGRVLGIAAGSASITATSGNTTSAPVTVTVTTGNVAAVFTMTSNTFLPFQHIIRVGQTVLFDFPADQHNVIFAQRNGKPADIPATASTAVTRVFNVAGTFPFDCTLHPGMSGQVIVNP
jgi:plastocyanin